VVFSALVFLLAANSLGVLPSSAAIDCPSPADVTDAIGRRMPAPAVGDSDWSVSYAVEGSPPARVVSLRLLAADGAPVLERRFALVEGECVTAAATIAVIVERYFRDLGWTTGAPLPPVNVREPPPLPAAADAAASEKLRLSAGVAVRGTGTAGVAASIGGRLRLLGPVHLGLAMLVPSDHATQTLALGGQVQVDGWQGRLSAWVVTAGSRLEWGAGLDALASVQTASSSGITDPARKSRAVLAVGVGGGPCLHLGRRWRIALDLAVYRTLPVTTLYVTENGVDHDVLAPSRWRFLAALGIGYALLN